MLWGLAFALTFFWLLGIAMAITGGGLIHILGALAVSTIVVWVLKPKPAHP
jgi:hypothetical protein